MFRRWSALGRYKNGEIGRQNTDHALPRSGRAIQLVTTLIRSFDRTCRTESDFLSPPSDLKYRRPFADVRVRSLG